MKTQSKAFVLFSILLQASAALAPGRDYVLTLLADDPADASARGYRCETRTVRKGDVLTVKMSASGGFCGTIADKR